MNSRLDAIQAAVLSARLPHLDQWTQRRQGSPGRYRDGLRDLGVDAVATPTVPEGFEHVFHQYTIRSERRDALKEFLAAKAIGSTVYYPVPLHRQPALTEPGKVVPPLPGCEEAARTVLSLPMLRRRGGPGGGGRRPL